MKKELTPEETCRRNYLLLLISALKHCKLYHVGSVTLNQPDKEVIMYSPKDVAAHAVLEETSQDDCVQLFMQRIGRLVTCHKPEWRRLDDTLKRHGHLLSKEERDGCAVLLKYFLSQKRQEA